MSFAVTLQMSLEIGSLVEGTMANGALVWSFLQMGDLVHGQSTRLAESFAAIAALEWLLLGVNITMIAQMVLATESFAANVAGVGTLIGVGALMDEQIVGFGKVTIAVFANELLLWSGAGGRNT